MIQTEISHYVKGLDPIADAFAGTVYSDIVNLSQYKHAEFIVFWGVGATGTTLITVEACDNVTPSNVSAVAFNYRIISTGDTHGALTAATSTGFTTTAGSSQVYIIEIDSDALAASGYKYARVKAVEAVDSPILGGILIRLSEPRDAQAITPSAIV